MEGPEESPYGDSFVSIAHRFDGGGAHQRVRGDDVAALAFVPRRPRLAHHSLAPSWEALVEAAGVEAPPLSFAEPTDLAEILGRQAHLGALAIVAPALDLDPSGVPVGVQFDMLAPRVGAGFFGDDHNSPSPLDGRRFRVERTEHAVRILGWQHFALPNPLDLEGRFAPDRAAPWGWIRVTYDLFGDGRARAYLGSSFLPAVWFYRDGQRVHRVDVAQCSDSQIEAMLCAPGDRPTGTTHRQLDTGHGSVQRVTP